MTTRLKSLLNPPWYPRSLTASMFPPQHRRPNQPSIAKLCSHRSLMISLHSQSPKSQSSSLCKPRCSLPYLTALMAQLPKRQQALQHRGVWNHQSLTISLPRQLQKSLPMLHHKGLCNHPFLTVSIHQVSSPRQILRPRAKLACSRQSLIVMIPPKPPKQSNQMGLQVALLFSIVTTSRPPKKAPNPQKRRRKKQKFLRTLIFSSPSQKSQYLTYGRSGRTGSSFWPRLDACCERWPVY
mmetsp:Transcript_7331/g.15277  ORF Transcript_7331/g.15277 Transcript_7331/m.15277 type:complete len:239 (+) Transcript_7331:2185-2901(+)